MYYTKRVSRVYGGEATAGLKRCRIGLGLRGYARRLTWLLLTCHLIALPAHAGPEGGTIRDGSGSISKSDLATLIRQHSNLLAIDWDSFDVGNEWLLGKNTKYHNKKGMPFALRVLV